MGLKGFLVLMLLSAGVMKASAQERAPDRRLVCVISVHTLNGEFVFASAPAIDIPEDAFNYTAGMQTFWVPLSTAYYNKFENRSSKITVTAALGKIGAGSGIDYISVVRSDLTGNSSEPRPVEIQGSNDVAELKNLMIENELVDVSCQLNKKSSQP